MLAFARQELSTWPVYINNRITTAAAPRCSDRPRLLAAEALLLETYRSVVETLQGAFRFVQGLLARARASLCAFTRVLLQDNGTQS
jgi:hypothetical protein